MSLKDKFNEYREEKERRDYFRKRNDLYVDNVTMTKTILGGLIVASSIVFVIRYIEDIFLIGISFAYLILGTIVANTVKNISGVKSETMGFVSALVVMAGICLGTSLYGFYYNGFDLSFIRCLELSISNVFDISNLFHFLFMLIGAYTAYMNAR